MDPNGSLTSSPKYDVYGLVRSNGGTASSKMGFVGGLGHLSEANTGLIYMRARYYDPQQGRFSSEDSDGHGTNWFIYASDNPTNRTDYTGKSDDVADIVNEALKYLGLAATGNAAYAFLAALAKALPAMAAVPLRQVGLILMSVGENLCLSGKAAASEGATLIKEAEAIDTSSEAGIIAAKSIYQAGALSTIGGAAQVALGETLYGIGEVAFGLGCMD